MHLRKVVLFTLFLSILAMLPCFCISTIQAEELTVGDYLATHPGEFSINEEGVLNLSKLGLHSLEGLEKVPHADQVTTLDLRGNNLNYIPADIFRTFKHLHVLWLKENKITLIDDKAFRGLRELTWLSLSNNQLLSLPDNVFEGLRQLRSLALRENYFTTFPKNLFTGLPSLKEIYLEKNQLIKKDFRTIHSLSRTVAIEFGQQYTPEGLIHRIQTLLEHTSS